MAKGNRRIAEAGKKQKAGIPGVGNQPVDGAPPFEGELKWIPIDEISSAPWNPNAEDAATFNELVDNLKEMGFGDTITVIPSEGGYVLVSGEHRWKAAKIAGMMVVPAMVRTDWNVDQAKMQTVAMNVIRGKLDPLKFTRLYKDLEKAYGPEAVRKLMGLSKKDGEFRRLMKEVTKGLPERVQTEIAKRADKIRNVEDLAAVVNSLYARFGSTVESNFMLLTYGGKVHVMVRMREDVFKRVRKLLEDCYSEGKDVNDELVKRLAPAA